MSLGGEGGSGGSFLSFCPHGRELRGNTKSVSHGFALSPPSVLATQSAARPAALTPCRNLLETQNLRPHPRPIDSELSFNKLSRQLVFTLRFGDVCCRFPVLLEP